MAIAAIGLASAAFVLAGYLTAWSSLLALLYSAAAFWRASPGLDLGTVRVGCGFAAVISLALLCLGPGTFSIDARRYGRREIIIPKRTTPTSE